MCETTGMVDEVYPFFLIFLPLLYCPIRGGSEQELQQLRSICILHFRFYQDPIRYGRAEPSRAFPKKQKQQRRTTMRCSKSSSSAAAVAKTLFQKRFSPPRRGTIFSIIATKSNVANDLRNCSWSPRDLRSSIRIWASKDSAAERSPSPQKLRSCFFLLGCCRFEVWT